MLYRLTLFLSIIFAATAGYAQQNKQPHEAIPISDILPFYNYERIREYAFAEGDKKDYCIGYPQLPHLKINSLDTDLYFVNYPVVKNPGIENYSIMYLVTDFNGNPVNFYIYMTDSTKIYLYDYRDLFREPQSREKALTELRQKITAILNKIGTNT